MNETTRRRRMISHSLRRVAALSEEIANWSVKSDQINESLKGRARVAKIDGYERKISSCEHELYMIRTSIFRGELGEIIREELRETLWNVGLPESQLKELNFQLDNETGILKVFFHNNREILDDHKIHHAGHAEFHDGSLYFLRSIRPGALIVVRDGKFVHYKESRQRHPG